jgi:hypothetical protein
MISLNEQEKEIVILALTKVLENDHSYRVDEYKKVLDRLKADENHQDYVQHVHLLHDIDEY